MDQQNQGDNSLVAKQRNQFGSINPGAADGSKNAKRRLKSPKNSKVNITNKNPVA